MVRHSGGVSLVERFQGSYWIYRNHQTQAVDCTWYKHGPYYELESQCHLPQFEKIWFFVNSPFLVRFDLKGGKDSNATITWLHEVVMAA